MKCVCLCRHGAHPATATAAAAGLPHGSSHAAEHAGNDGNEFWGTNAARSYAHTGEDVINHNNPWRSIHFIVQLLFHIFSTFLDLTAPSVLEDLLKQELLCVVDFITDFTECQLHARKHACVLFCLFKFFGFVFVRQSGMAIGMQTPGMAFLGQPQFMGMRPAGPQYTADMQKQMAEEHQ